MRRRQGQADLHRLLAHGARRLDRSRLIRLHDPYPLDTSGRDATWFTVMREPVARFMSGYRKRLDPDVVPTARIERLHEVDRALYDHWRRRFEHAYQPILAALERNASLR